MMTVLTTIMIVTIVTITIDTLLVGFFHVVCVDVVTRVVCNFIAYVTDVPQCIGLFLNLWMLSILEYWE